MRIARMCLIPAVLLASSFLLAACGDSDEDQITEVIQTSVKSTDPADCTKLQTQTFLNQTEFALGQDAVQQCQQEASDTSDNPDSVDITDVKVDGDTGTANVAFKGGTFDGSTVSVELVKSDDDWKLNKITGIPKFNLGGFAKALTQRLIAEGQTPEEVVNCIGDALNNVGEDQVKAVLISGDSSQLTALFANCG